MMRFCVNVSDGISLSALRKFLVNGDFTGFRYSSGDDALNRAQNAPYHAHWEYLEKNIQGRYEVHYLKGVLVRQKKGLEAIKAPNLCASFLFNGQT